MCRDTAGYMTTSAEKLIPVSVSGIPASVLQELEKAAANEERTRTAQIRKILIDWAKRHQAERTGKQRAA